MSGQRILVVDDDPKIRNLLRNCFEGEGYLVDEAWNLETLSKAFEGRVPDLMTLDLDLGREDGFDIARAVRRKHDLAIIMVTGKGDVIDRVVGLELGADDFITKPFHLREMVARVKSVLRRYEAPKQARTTAEAPATPGDCRVLKLDGLSIDLDRMVLLDRSGQDCGLTTADFKLLRAFIEHPNRPLSRDRLMDLIDGPGWVPFDRTIDNQVARLRKKIEREPANPKLVKTVRGIGYMLTEPAQRQPQNSSRSA